MKKVVILSNHHTYTYNLRKEIIQKLLDENYKVYIVLPYGEKVDLLKDMGCEFIDLPLDGRGMNPLTDLKLLLGYYEIIKKIKPSVVLTYTIKPNVYGGIACALTKTPYITNVTGLGTAIENNSIIRRGTLLLYKLGIKKSSCVFFQNNSNKKFFQENKIVENKTKLLPGSGVNLEQHPYEDYPNQEEIKFLFIGRIMKAKGIEEFLEAAKTVKEQHPNVHFDLIGSIEENYNEKIESLESQAIISYHGQQQDVHSFIKNSHAIILPSYHEGLANVLLESASTGRPILASKVPGCIETFEEGKTGLGFEVRNVNSLIKTIIKFIDLSYVEKRNMGIAGRRKIESEFDRKIVIDAYLNEIDSIIKKENYNEFI